MKRTAVAAGVAFGVFLLSGTRAARADGFFLNEQSARATGMGGAYVAQANDPSAIFYNPGGLALMQKKKGLSAGLTFSGYRQFLYQGLPPGAGAATTGEQKSGARLLPQAFLSMPFGKHAVIGLGAYSPFRMSSEWADAGGFAGRYVSVKSQIEAIDVAPAVSVAFGPLGIGATGIYRSSKISATRDIAANLDGVQRDVASVTMQTNAKSSYSWSAGVLFRPLPSFAIGATRRAAATVVYEGVGRMTQRPTGDTQLDQLVKASFPFGQDLALTAGLAFPEQTSAGIAVGSAQALLLEVDASRTSWKRTTDISFLFPNNPTLSARYPLRFQDTTSYRAGLRYQFATGPVLRAGYAMDKSPQPDETVGPFLIDADRRTITGGFGLDWLDIALSWTTFANRSVTTNVDQINGNYRASAWLLAVSVTK